MFTSKYMRVILPIVGVLLIVALFTPSFNQPAMTGAAPSTPPPRNTPLPPSPPPPSDPLATPAEPSDSGTSDNNSSDEIKAAIYGQVTDLSTGRPGQGLAVQINGSLVRTDSEGRYSLTGLQAGTYIAALQLPDQASPAQSIETVSLADEQTVTLDLTYYSGSPPTPISPTATPEPEPEPEPTLPAPEAAAAEFAPLEAEAQTQDISANFSPLTPTTGGKSAVWINPGHINNEKGVTGSIAIDVANVNDLGAFQASLEYDAKVIKIEDVTLGNFLDSTGRQTNPLVTEIDNTAGQVSFVAFTSGDAAGPDGGGTLAVINFTSKQAGISRLNLEEVLLVARLGKTLIAEVGDGQINVTLCFGDLNGDDVIDVGDVQAVAGRVKQKLGDPNYVLANDLNNDRVIDEADVALVTDRLGESCP